MTDLDLPQSVLDLVEFTPVEDLVLAILREGLPDVPIFSLIPEEIPSFFIFVRRLTPLGDWHGDARFTDTGRFGVDVLTKDPDGDEKGAVLSEAARVVLRNAWLQHRMYSGLGSIIRITMEQEPTRKTDWANSSGPVQFASLPSGTWRYEAVYGIEIRKPLSP